MSSALALDRIEEGDGVSVEDDSATGTATAEERLSSSADVPKLGQKETLYVNYSKCLVVVVILVMASAIGLVTYSYVSNQEDSAFKKQFDNVARDIVASSQLRSRGIFDNLESVSVSITAIANAMDTTWPFFVCPDFQVIGMVSNALTGAATLGFSPIVMDKDRAAWELFTIQTGKTWLAEGHKYDDTVAADLYEETRFPDQETGPAPPFPIPSWNETGVLPFISAFPDFDGGGFRPAPAEKEDFYVPFWQVAPAADFSPISNIDTNGPPGGRLINEALIKSGKPLLSPIINADYLKFSYDQRFPNPKDGIPHSYVYQPIFDSLNADRKVVAILNAFLRWDKFFYNVLPRGEKPIVVVLESTCQDTFTYELRGEDVVLLGQGDLHTEAYDGIVQEAEFAAFASLDAVSGGQSCSFSSRIYPTEEWSESFFTSNPYTYAAAVVSCFLVTTLVFIVYDCFVQKRNRTVMESATKTSQIVSSLFPSNVRDRLMDELTPVTEDPKKRQAWPKASEIAKNRISPIGDDHSNSNNYDMSMRDDSVRCMTSDRIFGSQPIADLFPNTTIMFGDMVGFTAWSSVREPTAVFMLLETVYHAFDMVAKRRRVFKVETIGDCYVAVAGLPQARKDHALIMARFANDCLERMDSIARELESHFGPDTAELCMRIGLHSGPVTAGVLRGEKGRFQLFGDTMNTASRMESTGTPHKIQISQETANLLIAAGKSKWIVPREEKIYAKGKGELQTHYLKLNPGSRVSTSETLSTASSYTGKEGEDDDASNSRFRLAAALASAEDVKEKNSRLVTWNVEILGKLLKQVVARRATNSGLFNIHGDHKQKSKPHHPKFNKSSRPLDEVVDVLSLPHFDADNFKKHVDPEAVELPAAAVSQLTEYISRIETLYNANPFHNFEHASHVTLSVTKLLGRIVNPIEVSRKVTRSESKFAHELHDHTFGITSDPLTHFAAVFSALVHDLDHLGVPNTVLVNENTSLARKYKGKSVAEQNSVDLAFKMLLQPEFQDLQDCIFANEDEYSRFRSLVVNLVLATDIMDKELGSQRKHRWAKAFSNEVSEASFNDEDFDTRQSKDTNRKATIVLEHLIQASDVAHTMQHWHVFRKWNERLFHEMYAMYLAGRLEKDPSIGWYEGEIGFFDFYIIPLARKLETCGVFGVSSSEYLGYAENNRKEWVTKGEEIVKGYLERFEMRQNIEMELSKTFPLEESSAGFTYDDSVPLPDGVTNEVEC